MASWKHYGTLTILGICCLIAGCNRNGGGTLGGNTSATGDKADQDPQKQDPQKQANQPKQGGQSTQLDEPQNAVDGKPSADSDRGSAGAVAHHSVAQPGAPQGTVPGEGPAPPTSKAASPHH